MILGVVLHSSLIYASDVDWAISSPEKSIFFYYLEFFIHTFRIPAFYLIAGFFSGLTISKYGYGKFLSKRLYRILIPLITTVFTVNIVDAYARFHINKDAGLSFTDFISQRLVTVFSSGEWDYHLWFLIFLLFYFIIAIGMLNIYQTAVKKFNLNRLVDRILNVSFIILIMPFFNIFVIGVGKFFPDLVYHKILGVFNMYTFTVFLPFYLLGIALYYKRTVLADFTKYKGKNILILAVSMFIYSYSAYIPNELLANFFETYSYYVMSWLLCSLCFFVFYHFFNKPSKLFLYLSDASYTIYLFHQITVILIGYLLFDLQISIYIKFIVVIIMTMIITLSIHHFLILKLKPLRFIYNGKWIR